MGIEPADEPRESVALDELGVYRNVRRNVEHRQGANLLKAEVANVPHNGRPLPFVNGYIQFLDFLVDERILKGVNRAAGAVPGFQMIDGVVVPGRAGDGVVNLPGPPLGTDFAGLDVLLLRPQTDSLEVQSHGLPDVHNFRQGSVGIQGQGELEPVRIAGFGQELLGRRRIVAVHFLPAFRPFRVNQPGPNLFIQRGKTGVGRDGHRGPGQQGFSDGFPVHRLGHGLPHRLQQHRIVLLEGIRLGVVVAPEVPEVGNPGIDPGNELHSPLVHFLPNGALNNRQMHLLGQQGGQPGLTFGNGPILQLVILRRHPPMLLGGVIQHMGTLDPLHIAQRAGADHLFAHPLVAHRCPAGFAFHRQIAPLAQVEQGFRQHDAQVDDHLMVVHDFHHFRGALGNGGLVIPFLDAHNLAPGADAAGLGRGLHQQPQGMTHILGAELAIAVLPRHPLPQIESPILAVGGHFPGFGQLRHISAAGVVDADQILIDRPLVQETANVDLVGVVGIPGLAADGDGYLVDPIVHGDRRHGRLRLGLRGRSGNHIFLPGSLRPGRSRRGRGRRRGGGCAAIRGGRPGAALFLLGRRGRLPGRGRLLGRSRRLLLRRRLGRRGRSRRLLSGRTAGHYQSQG